MSQTAAGLLQVGLLIVALAAVYRPLGDYYPRGFYFQHAAKFDAFVNANGGCQGFTWPAKDPETYRPPGVTG